MPVVRIEFQTKEDFEKAKNQLLYIIAPMVSKHLWKLNVLSSLYVVLTAIGLAILEEPACTSPDVVIAVPQTIQTTIVINRVNVRFVTEIIKLFQTYAQHTSIPYNTTDTSFYLNLPLFVTMKLLSLNCKSWNTAKDSIKSLVSNYNLDLICLSETWEKENKPLQFGSWLVISKPRDNNSGHGGVAILCKTSDEFFIVL